jgi:transposase
MNVTYLGLDVAKATLDIAGPSIKTTQVPNSAEGHRQLVSMIKTLPGVVHVVCEATGGYERGLVAALMAAGISVCRVNPCRVRLFAKSIGQLAKTDRLDAALLAEFGRQTQPRPLVLYNQALEELRALYDRRRHLVAWHTVEENRLETALKKMVPLINKTLRFLDRQIEEVERLIDAHVAAHQEIQTKVARMELVKGVGRVTATVLLAHMPQIGSVTDNQAAALAGVAPYNNDSGPSHGKRSIRGGRHQIRSVLYMAAVAAARYNPILRAFYLRLRQKGKPAKVALTAVMRKLVVLLNRLIKNPNFALA